MSNSVADTVRETWRNALALTNAQAAVLSQTDLQRRVNKATLGLTDAAMARLSQADLEQLIESEPPSLFSDNFNRANNASSLGDPWVTASGTIGILNNQVYTPNANGGRAYVDVGAADMDVSVTVAAFDSASEHFLHFRADTATSWWRFGRTSGNYVLQNYNGVGDPTSFTTSVAPANGDVLRVLANGNSIVCYVNGVEARNLAFDTFNNNKTKVGLEIWKATASGTRFEDLVVVAP